MAGKRKKLSFVRSESIQGKRAGLNNYCDYLVSLDHPNHENTNSIIKLFNSIKAFRRGVINRAEEYQQKLYSKKQGGKNLNSLAQSFVLSPPKKLDVTEEQWKKIAKTVAMAIYDRLVDPERGVQGLEEMTPQEFSQSLFMNVHDQENGHLNIVVGRIMNGINIQRVITRPSMKNLLKRTFTAELKTVCGFDMEQYEYEQEHPKKKKSRSSELADRAGLLKEQEKIIVKTQKILMNDVKRIAKLHDALHNGNMKQIERQTNRLLKSLDEIEEILALAPLSKTQRKTLEEHKKTIDKVGEDLHLNRIVDRKIKPK